MLYLYLCVTMFVLGTYARDMGTRKKFLWSLLAALTWPAALVIMLVEQIRK